jgi:hypothetical protein
MDEVCETVRCRSILLLQETVSAPYLGNICADGVDQDEDRLTDGLLIRLMRAGYARGLLRRGSATTTLSVRHRTMSEAASGLVQWA